MVKEMDSNCAYYSVPKSFFPQETKFKEAAGFYEAIVKKNFDNVSAYRSNCDDFIFLLLSWWVSVQSSWPISVSPTS